MCISFTPMLASIYTALKPTACNMLHKSLDNVNGGQIESVWLKMFEI